MLIQEVSFTRFCDSFSDTYKNNFTYEGKRALFDYLEQLSQDTGENIELDTVAICCEYTEYSDLIECAGEFFAFEGMTFDEEGNEMETREEVEEKARKFLENNTRLIEFDGGVIIQNF